MAQQHPEQLKVYYTVDKSKPGWEYGTGYVTKTMLTNNFEGFADSDIASFICGPQPM
ncbi:MAG: NADH-cytochrome b5 reductase 3, partial [Paramarteilia canceri]